MPIYKVGDRKYNVPQEELEGFLAEFPQAEEFTEGKISTTEPDTTVDVTEVSNTESLSEDGSLELEEIKYKTPLTLEEKKSLQNNQFAKQMAKEDNFTKERLEELQIENPDEVSILESLAARTARGFVSSAKGLSNVKDAILLGIASAGQDFNEEEKIIAKQMIESGISAPTGMANVSTSKFIELEEILSESVRKTNNESITQALDNLDFAEAAELTVGGALESVPSLLAAFSGYGGIALLGASVSGNKFDEELKNNPKEALSTLTINAIGSGAIEAGFELATRGLLSKAGFIKNKQGVEAAKELIQKGSESIIKKLGLSSLGEGASEASTEIASMLYDDLTLGKKVSSGEAITRIIDAGIVGSFVGGNITSISEIGGASQAARNRAEYILTPSEIQKKYRGSAIKLSELVKSLKNADTPESKKVILEQIENIEQQVIKAKAEVSRSLNELTEEELNQYASNQKQILEKTNVVKDQKDENIIKTAKDQIQGLNQANIDLFGVAAQRILDKDIAFAEAEAGKYGLEVEVFENPEDFGNAEGVGVENIDADGVVVGNKVLINKDRASKVGAVSVGSHELLHGILKNAISSGQAGVEIINNFKTQLNSSQKKAVEARLKAKDSNGNRLYSDEYLAENPDEYLTAFSDAIQKKEISFEENIFTKIGDLITPLLRKIGFSKIKFNTGKDVYNFMREYNKSITQGALSKDIVEATSGEIVFEEIVRSNTNEQASAKVQELYDTQGEAAAFDIIEQFKPITNKIVEKRSQAPGFDRQLLTDEIETGKRGILDLIKEYKSETGTPLAAYINKLLPSRAIEASRRILGEEFTEDVTEAKGVAAEEASIEVAKTEKQATSKLRRVLGIKQGDDIYNLAKEVSSEILSGDLPGKKVKTAINREARKSELRKAVSDLMGTEKAIDEQFLNKNILNILKALPASDLVKLERESKVKVLAEQGPRLNVKDAREAVNKGLLPKDTNLQSGPKVSSKLPTTLEQAKEFFTQKRKAGLVNVVTEMLVKDAAPEVTEGKMEPAKRAKVLSEIDREPTLKFSKSLKDKPDLLKYFNEELKGLSPGQIVQEIEFLENRAEILGMEQDEAFEQMFTNDNSYKKLRKTLKLKDGGKRNISSKENSKQLKKTHSLFIKGMIPKGKEFKDLPKQTQQFLLDTVGFGDTRITIGDVPLTYKAVTEGVKGYEGLLAKMYGKDILKGTGSDFNFIDVFAPRNWGEKGFRGKVQKIVESNKDNKLKARKEVEKLLTSKDGNVTKTIKANRDTLTRAYDVLADIVIKNPSKETISAVADLLESQVNRATGVFKGLVPVTSFNMKPEKGNTKNENKMMHNEHLVELFNANKFFIESLSKFVEGKINESELLNMSRVNAASLEQAVISERMRVEKDASGAAVRDFLNPLTFLGKDAVNQVPIGVESLAVSEQIAQDLEKKQKELVKKASDKKLNSVGVIVKQLLDNNRVYLYTKSKNSDKLSKLIKLSKSETNQEILNIMKSVDDASQKVELKFSKSLDLNKDFNDIIENKTGIASDKTYARVKAEVAGASKGKFNFFIPPSAEDFVGLLYSTLGKGSTGDAQMAWYKAHLLNPFARAMENIANDRVAMIQDYKGLKKALKIVPKDLRKKVPGEPFTREQAVRVYIWDQQGMEIPGLSKKDQSDLVKYVNDSTELTAFADQLIAINKGDEYASPDAGWVAGTIDTDFLKALNTTKRAKYLEVWQQNVDEIFSETNLNKLEAAYGKPYRVAMENILHRMKTGRNRSFGTDTITGRFTDWLTNSVGAIMFFNTRSAVLQTISAVNFINFSDNNVLKAGQAFANQPQYWSDFKKLFNSPFLLDRRSGIKLNVNEADIAEMAKGPGNSARNVIAGLLKAGFLPTQLADSFAIASGGASFYRNRIKALKKEGLTEAEAEEIAFRDFREIAEESQQSSRPDKISQQQAGPLGRVVLAFANTPAQYARLIKKAASDLKNGRGDAKTNISKIIYYGVAQNVLFSALQQALFAVSFGDDEEEEEKRNEKYFNIANGMADSILRGIGVGGAIASVVKNTAIKLAKEEEKRSPKYQDVLVKEVLQISPPISSKVGKLRSAGRSLSWNKKEMMTKGWSIDNPAYLASANVISAVTNLPADRAVKKITNLVDASNEEIEYYKRIALALGWSSWELGIDKKDKKKPESSTGKTRTRKRTRTKKRRN